MLSTGCKPVIIGAGTGGMESWAYEQAHRLTNHLGTCHLVITGATRADGYYQLCVDPERGMHWEILRLQGNLGGGGAYSLMPLTEMDVMRLYGCYPPRAKDELAVLVGALVVTDSHWVLDHTAEIVAHLADRHLVTPHDGCAADGLDPETGRVWQISVSEGYDKAPLRPLTAMVGLGNADSADLGGMAKCGQDSAPAEETEMKEYAQLPIVGKMETIDGQCVRNRAARVAEHLLELHLLETGAEREEGARRLYYNPVRQHYWELIHPETGQYGEGIPSLLPVARDDVRSLYGIEPSARVQTVRLAAQSLEDGEDASDKVVRLILHYMKLHLIATGTDHLYRDPVEDRFYHIGHALVPADAVDGFGAGWMVAGPLSMTELTYSEVLERYGCAPFEGSTRNES